MLDLSKYTKTNKLSYVTFKRTNAIVIRNALEMCGEVDLEDFKIVNYHPNLPKEMVEKYEVDELNRGWSLFISYYKQEDAEEIVSDAIDDDDAYELMKRRIDECTEE